jgi:predicted Zn-dependent peptidase
MLNRKETPILTPIEHIAFVEPASYEVSPHVKLYHLKDVPNETSRLDIYFNAGSVQGNPTLAGLTSAMLLSGTKEKSAQQIQDEINSLGGFFENGVSQENAVITVFALKENMFKIMEIIVDAIENCTFPLAEFHDILNERKQKHLVQLEKVSFLAQRAFQQRLFHDSAYGRVTQIEDYDQIKLEEIIDFYRKYYLEGLSKVAIVGNFNQDEIDAFIDLSGRFSSSYQTEFVPLIPNLKGLIHVEKEGALQTAIRVGRTLLHRKHPDYHDLMVTNTILGDYFGSRLMSNIREDKGYTYGIGSMIADLQKFSYFLIATEVGKDVKTATLNEIKNELELLQNELIDAEELELVRNYMIGQMLKSADGPYAMMDLFLSAEMFDLDYEFYNEAIESMNRITPERIQEIAKKYLIWDEMTIVSAG